MAEEDVVSVVVDRIVEELTAMRDDPRWQDEILEITETDDRKAVKATVTHFIQMIESEI